MLGARIAKRYKLICFDEFHVADITDAMILHRLLVALFDNGVGFVTTSNFKPDDLYPDGLHRDRILPAIALLNERMEVVNVDNGTDYRRRTLENARLYHCPLGPQADAEMAQTFDQLAEVHDEDPVLHIEAREIHALRKAGGVVWFDFRELCMGPRSQNDYLEIATQFHTVLLSGVPRCRRAWPARAALHLAGGRAVRPARQAHHVGRRGARSSCTPKARWRMSFRAPSRASTRCSPRNTCAWSAAWWIPG